MKKLPCNHKVINYIIKRDEEGEIVYEDEQDEQSIMTQDNVNFYCWQCLESIKPDFEVKNNYAK